METSIPEDQLALVKAVTEESRDGIVIYDASGSVLHENPSASGLLSEIAEGTSDELNKFCVNAIRLHRRQEVRLNGFVLIASPLRSRTRERIGILTIRHSTHVPTCIELRERFGLSARQAEVAVFLLERHTDVEIARMLGISWHTVRSHVEKIFSMLGCHSRREAAEILRGSVNDAR